MSPLPVAHVTDLYHPPQDPDDQLDLLTLACLPELAPRAVILDLTQRFLDPAPEGFDHARDPGYVLVSQLGHLLGRALPCAVGPFAPLTSPEDAARDRSRAEQGGIELLLEVLARSDEPVVISVVGSARVPAAAFNRAPRLMRAKTRAILLNAGATGGTKTEWNVGLDPFAYRRLWESGLPIDWFPCATERSAFEPEAARGTFWRADHATLFADFPPRLRAWIAYGFTGSARNDLIRALDDLGQGAVWEHVLAGRRNLWSTASLVMAADRVLARMREGWRFVPRRAAEGFPIWPWRLDPIRARWEEEAGVRWEPCPEPSRHRLFGRQPGADYAAAMAEALNALFRAFPA
jgi:pyrimidine-specific ribonucleoside hydrolase